MGSMMEEITLQTLYEHQDYETLVKRTASLTDLNMIRYHIIGLLGLGANQMVLRVMLAKFAVLQKALSIFIKIHYEILFITVMFNKIINIINIFTNSIIDFILYGTFIITTLWIFFDFFYCLF